MAVDGVDEAAIAPARAYPSQKEVAVMLDVSESALSRSAVEAITAARGRYYSPTQVLHLATHYRRRTLNEVAGSLLERTERCAPESADDVRGEIEQFFAERAAPSVDRAQFLDEAKRTLPRRLYEQVQRAYEDGSVDALESKFSGETSSVTA